MGIIQNRHVPDVPFTLGTKNSIALSLGFSQARILSLLRYRQSRTVLYLLPRQFPVIG